MQFPQAVVNVPFFGLFCFVLFCFCRKANVDSESEKVTQVSAYSLNDGTRPRARDLKPYHVLL